LAEKKTPLHAVLEFALGDEEIVARLSSRRTCRDCGAPSVGLDKCPTCGGEVYQREDDKAEVIKRRLEVYSEQTAPIIAFYQNEGLLISISAVGSVEAITDSAILALKNVVQ
jgi:adenylate kinase